MTDEIDEDASYAAILPQQVLHAFETSGALLQFLGQGESTEADFSEYTQILCKLKALEMQLMLDLAKSVWLHPQKDKLIEAMGDMFTAIASTTSNILMTIMAASEDSTDQEVLVETFPKWFPECFITPKPETPAEPSEHSSELADAVMTLKETLENIPALQK